MSLRRILTIFRRDFRDAVRDARVLLAIAVPLALGLFYNLTFDDAVARQHATLAYVAADATTLPQTVRAVAGDAVAVSIREAADPDQLQELVDEQADVGLLIPPGFDAAVAAGRQPDLGVLLPEAPGFESDYLVGALNAALREMAGQEAPATVQVQTVEARSDASVIERIALRKYFVLIAAIMQVTMITMYAVPYILAEEAEKRTLDALVMIASYAEVVSAKALFGLVYAALSVVLLFGVTGIAPTDPVLLVSGFFLLSLTLTGLGLLLGSVLRASQLTAWGGVILLPILAPAFVVGIPVPATFKAVALAFPTSHGTRLALDGITDEQLFGNLWLSFLVIAAWGVAAYALLLWSLRRREA